VIKEVSRFEAPSVTRQSFSFPIFQGMVEDCGGVVSLME